MVCPLKSKVPPRLNVTIFPMFRSFLDLQESQIRLVRERKRYRKREKRKWWGRGRERVFRYPILATTWLQEGKNPCLPLMYSNENGEGEITGHEAMMARLG